VKTVIIIALLISLVYGVAQTSAAGDFAGELREAQQALKEGKYDTAFAAYRVAAEEKNNPLAQFTLALFYQNGWGRKADPVAACQWQEKAAHGAIPAACHYYAECLEKGVHRPADPAAAAAWYEKAVELGHSGSLCSLARLYMTGQGVPKDPAKGLLLCRKATENGLLPAEIQMGRFYLEGPAEIRDPVRAYQWFSAAAQQNAAEAQYYLGVLERDGLDRPKAPEKALFWFESAAAQGYLPAYYPTAELYFTAPVDPETKKLSAENLAKAYLWLSATVQRSENSQEKKNAAEMLSIVRRTMPASWGTALDEKVAQHLAGHSAKTPPK
jgi:TPR repeat protein